VCGKGRGEGERQVERERVVRPRYRCAWGKDARFSGFLRSPSGSVLGCRHRTDAGDMRGKVLSQGTGGREGPWAWATSPCCKGRSLAGSALAPGTRRVRQQPPACCHPPRSASRK